MKWRSGLVSFVLVVTMLLLRLGIGSYQEYHAAKQLESQAQLSAAAWHYGTAMRWYFPGNPWVSKSVASLLQLAEQSSGVQQRYETLQIAHAALNAIRSFYQPYRQVLQHIDELLAAATIQLNPQQQLNQHEVYAQLQRRLDPTLGWSLLASVAILCWLGLAVGVILVAFDNQGRWRQRRPSYLLAAGTMVSFLFWLVAVWQA